jgi:hypothetical protein
MLCDVTTKRGQSFAENCVSAGANAISAVVTLNGQEQKAGVYDDCFGQWFVFAEAIGPWAVIRAQSFEDALDIFMSEFLPAEQPEDDADAELGTWTGDGKWYSEVTTSYVTSINPERVIVQFKRQS